MSRREALRTIGMGGTLGAVAAGAVYAVSPAAATEPDAELIRLGGELIAAWQFELDVWDETREDYSDEAAERDRAAYEVRREVIERIEAIPATTVAGLAVKAMAFCTCEIEWPADDLDGSLYVGDRLQLQIRREVRGVA